MTDERRAERLLLVDTCGEQGWVAMFCGDEKVAERRLPERTASASLLRAVRDVLAAAKMRLGELSGIGVVNGPGSFTGLRVGLAVVKGLCEADDLPMAAVSRLEMLAGAAHLRDGFAVLRAGRDQVYLREVRDGEAVNERLIELKDLAALAGTVDVVYMEDSLGSALEAVGVTSRLVTIEAGHVLGPVRRCFAAGGSARATVDANYVRDEATIYARGAQHR